MSIKYVYNTNILDTKYQIIAQQCNCVSKTAKGLTEQIVKRFPYANFYAKRNKHSTPGTIEVRGGKGIGRWICAMYAQIYPGAAKKEDDELFDRERYFKSCLTKISKIKNLREIAFPAHIGCGLAKGNWKTYETMIINFAKDNPNIDVYIVDLESYKYDESFVKWLCKQIKNDHNLLNDIPGMWVTKKLMEYEENEGEVNNPTESDGSESENITVSTWSNSNLELYTEQNIPEGWEDFFQNQLDVDYGSIHELSKYLDSEIQKGDIFPELHLVYNVFTIIPPKDIKVLVIGQDPYINLGEAMGISFSVPEGINIPPSLRNIYKELQDDGFKIKNTASGDLTKWCHQGVFLLNTALTVRAHESASHSKKWLENFTPALMRWINDNCGPLVVILWGSHAQSFAKYFGEKHKKIMCVHPSPLSAHRGFFGSKPFSQTNELLKKLGNGPIDWSL